MKLHRFIGEFNLTGDTLRLNERGVIEQIRKVLRLKPGERLILGDGKLNEALVEIVDMDKDYIEFNLLNKYRNENEPEMMVFLYAAIIKKENFELIVQKATEVGVRKIIPIITERTVKTGLNLSRLKVIAKEASEQSGRGIIPEISEPLTFSNATEETDGPSIIYSLTNHSENREGKTNYKKINIFIGPEGGFSDKEVEQAKAKNFEVRSLGKLTLRAETAAIISTYLEVNKK